MRLYVPYVTMQGVVSKEHIWVAKVHQRRNDVTSLAKVFLFFWIPTGVPTPPRESPENPEGP